MIPMADVITAEQVPELLIASAGWVAEAWHEVAEDNAEPDSPGGRLGYLDAGWIVGRLADRFAAGTMSSVPGCARCP